MQLEHARKLGMKIVQALTPACDRIAIAGSVRRGQSDPKDLEIVYVPRIEIRPINLIDLAPIPVTETLINIFIRTRYWRLDDEVRRNGPRYKRLVIPPVSFWHPGGLDPIVVELFRADHDNWGYIYALRTGPSDFNQVLVRKPWHGGACPIDVTLRDGKVWRDGNFVPVVEEKEFFQVMGLPYWPPDERSAARLGKWLIENKRKGQNENLTTT